jgi:hypothetical protein
VFANLTTKFHISGRRILRVELRAKARISIIVECYDDHNEKVLEESHESSYVFDSWQQAQATYQLVKSNVQDRQTREREKLGQKEALTAKPFSK